MHNGRVRSPPQVLGGWFIGYITRPREEYRRWFFNDPVRLKSRIRPGDVLLVEGDQRVSQAIQYLTMSPWSHSAMYVGSALLRDPERRPEVRRRFGSEARYLVVEALVESGVVASPLTKYIDYNIRVCRPIGLSPEQIRTVVDDVVSRIGYRYDQRNVTDLCRYLLPFHLIPSRLKEEALHFGSGRDTETICSSMLAEAFARVGFAIKPVHVRRSAQRRGIWARLLGRRARRAFSGLLRTRHSSLCVPRDFDLSPSFDVVKFNAREPITFPHVRAD